MLRHSHQNPNFQEYDEALGLSETTFERNEFVHYYLHNYFRINILKLMHNL
jgi:hypothetical protein